MRTIQFKLDTDESEELQIVQERAVETHGAKPSPKALFLSALRNPPGILKIDVDEETKTSWGSVCGRPEFKYMPPVGVLSALIRSYVSANTTPQEAAAASKKLSAADEQATFRINRIKKWASMDADWRWVNRDSFTKYADPAIVEKCGGDAFQALEFEALQYEE